MKMKQVITIINLLLLAACSPNKEQVNEPEIPVETEPVGEVEENNKAEEDAVTNEDIDILTQLSAPSMPETLEEVVEYPVGQFASIQDDGVEEILGAIPVFPKDASEEEQKRLLAYLYSLFKKEYKLSEQAFAEINSIDGSDSDNSKQKETFNVEIILDASGSM